MGYWTTDNTHDIERVKEVVDYFTNPKYIVDDYVLVSIDDGKTYVKVPVRKLK